LTSKLKAEGIYNKEDLDSCPYEKLQQINNSLTKSLRLSSHGDKFVMPDFPVYMVKHNAKFNNKENYELKHFYRSKSQKAQVTIG